MAYLMAGRN